MPGIVVGGALANKPGNGGNVWAVLSWVRGFRNLGMPTCFVEQIRREHCVDAAGAPAPFRESANLAYFARATAALGVADCAALILDDGAEIHGMSRSALEEAAETSALLVNITGHLTWRHLTQRCRRKAYVDFDPAYTQIWNAQGNPGPRLEHHDVYFTLGENIGRPECSVPTGNIDWLHVRQPVVLNDWPVAVTVECEQFTTVASWRGPYGLLEHEGKTLGGKVHEFRKFIEVPRHTGARLELALDIHPADAGDRQRLEAHGWTVVDAGEVAATPEGFQAYVQRSFAEFSVAQGAYVGTHCGWFSDRTVRYLATGRPAVVQDTGFSRNFPVGDGLLAFSTVQEAISGIEDIRRNYAQHSRAARQLAERYFDSDKVLSQFIEAAGA